MFTALEIQNALTASWRLLRNRSDGLHLYDTSIEGFWRSFGVLVLLVPFYGMILIAQRKFLIEGTDLDVNTFPMSGFVFWISLGVVLDWILFPIIMALLARPMGLSNRYVIFIVARNWVSLIAIQAFVIPAALYALGILPMIALPLLNLIAIVFVLRYYYIVARETLLTPISVSIGIVILNFALGVVIDQLCLRMIGI